MTDSGPVRRTTSLTALAAALVKAQAQVKGAVKDSTNPYFKSRYADLASVWDACRAALTANGLSVSQFPGFEDGNPGVATVTTILLHASGEWLEGTAGCPIKSADAQGVGSAITYLRRYALAAVLGIVQEDDDGERASPRETPMKAATKPAPAKPDANGGLKWKGKLLSEFPSEDLVRLRGWCVKTDPVKFAPETEAIDEILAGREGQ